MKPLLVGEAPSQLARPGKDTALRGRPARTLLRSMGVEAEIRADGDPWYEELRARFDAVNLLHAYPGERWPQEAARLAAEGVPKNPVRVLLGRRVASAFSVGDAPYFEWMGESLIVIPHPSGLNRLLNDDKVRDAMGIALREAIMKANLGRNQPTVGSTDA